MPRSLDIKSVGEGAVRVRCYFTRNNHIVAVQELAAESDADAIKQAERLLEERPEQFGSFEIWDGARLVHRHPHERHRS
jgi:hypothetical protein